jgi:hypothetical protein
MGWSKSSAGRRPTTYRITGPGARPLHEGTGGGGSAGAPSSERLSGPAPGGIGPGQPNLPPETVLQSQEAPGAEKAQTLPDAGPGNTSKRNRRSLPVYDVASGEDLETPVNLDNSLLQAMFPNLQLALGQAPPPPANATPEQVEAHWQAVLEDLVQDLAGQEAIALDIATGGRKEGRFLYTDGQIGPRVADTHEKIMAYGGLLASPCLQPPKFIEGVRILVVPEGEMGTGDCAGKISRRLAALWDKDGSEAGQFRLGVQLDEDTILVGKGTLKGMDRVDVDAEGRGYDLILPDSSFKGNTPAFGEHTWDVHLGFNAWSTERRTKLSYQILQWFDPELIEQCIFPRADTRVPILLDAMKTSEGARQFLKLEREDREAEDFGELGRAVIETERGELEAGDAREPTVLEEVLLADTSGQMIDHPYVQSGLKRRLRQVWHDLAVGGGVKVPSFMGLPDSFRGNVDWLPEGTIVCPDLPPGEVLATRYPIRTRHDVQVWQNLDWQSAFKLTGLDKAIDPATMRSFFRYAEGHKGVVFMSHATAKRVGGDFDGDVFQVMPVTPHKPLDEIKNPNREWSDLAPLVDQVRREGWGSQGTTPKVKRRLATHVAPEQPKKVTPDNRKWLDSAAIHQGGRREQFLVELGRHLDGQDLAPEERAEVAEALGAVASDPERSLDEAVTIAEAYGFDAHGWISGREGDLYGLARRYNREQAARQALKNMDSALGQIVYTVSRVNASDRFTPEERERTISRLAEELQAEVDKFKYDTAANMDYVNEVRKRVGRELVWLDVHKDPDIFTRETQLSPSRDAVSHLWNHVSREFRAWERAPEPPSHFKGLLPAEYSPEQYALARQQVKTYNKTVARAMQSQDDKAMVSAIQQMEDWSATYSDPAERRVMAQAVWHAAHESTKAGGTASAAFHAFRPEMLSQLQTPQPLPAREITILGPQHTNNLGERVVEYDQPRTTRIRVLLEDYTDTYGRTERRLAAYELEAGQQPGQRLGYLPKDAPRHTGDYLATLQRREPGKANSRIEGRLAPLREAGQPH